MEDQPMFEVGDRVRMVQTSSTGIIAGEVAPTGDDGGPRIPIRWDNTGVVNTWDPAYLRPADTDPADDPDEVVVGGFARRRTRISVDADGLMTIAPEGFGRR
jgi:hypothetical protein